MKKTNHGELFSYIDGFHDTHELGSITEPSTFQKLVSSMGTSPADTLFLTKGVAEGEAAKQAGIHAILVISHGHQLKRYSPEDLAAFERIQSFDELIWRDADGGSQVAPGSASGTTETSVTGTTETSAAAEEAAVMASEGESAVPGSGTASGSGVTGSVANSGTGNKVSSQTSGSKVSGSPGSGSYAGSGAPGSGAPTSEPGSSTQ